MRRVSSSSTWPRSRRSRVAGPPGTFLVAYRRERPVGGVGMQVREPGSAEVKHLYVRPGERGRGGVSCLLTDQLRRLAIDGGIRRLVLAVLVDGMIDPRPPPSRVRPRARCGRVWAWPRNERTVGAILSNRRCRRRPRRRRRRPWPVAHLSATCSRWPLWRWPISSAPRWACAWPMPTRTSLPSSLPRGPRSPP